MALLLTLLPTAPLRAEPMPVLRCEWSPTGEIVLDARGVTIADALHSVASMGGFDVVIDEGVPRPLVNVTVSAAEIEGVLRQILRGRNHALVYDADTASLSQVIVLVPSAPRTPNLTSYRRQIGGPRATGRR